MSIHLTVQMTIQRGKSSEFETAISAAIARVKAEDAGCEMYDLFRGVDDGTRYVMVESWATQEHLDAHRKSPAMAEMMKIGPLLAGPPVMSQSAD